MNTQALVERVSQATPEEKKLIAALLVAPDALKHSVSEALAEINKETIRGKFLEYVVGAAVAVSKEATIAPDLSIESKGLEAMVSVFTQPAALQVLAPKDPLAAARLRGLKVKADLLYGDDQSLTSEEVADLLHITRQAVDKKRRNNQLLGLSLGRRGYRYPSWQFHSGRILPGLDRVLGTLKDYDPWTQAMFLKTGDIRLDGETPLERLKSGDIDAVVKAAECYGEHGAA